MNLKKVKHLSLEDAAKYFETSVDVLCDWILENPTLIVARSDYDRDRFHPLSEETLRPLLSAAGKRLRRVAFDYPPEIKKFRLTGSSRFDDQQISRSDLRIAVSEIRRIQNVVTDEIGGIGIQSYGVKKVRKATRKWALLHKVMLTAAQEILQKHPEKFRKSGDKIHFANLADYLDENRKNWPELAQSPTGTSHRNIYDQILKAKDQLVLPKKRT